MRVCMITPEFPPYRVGGIGAYVAALAEGIGARGHTVDVAGCDIHPESGTIRHPWGRSISLATGSHALNRPFARAAEGSLRWLSRHHAPAVWRVHPYLGQCGLIASALVIRRFVRRHGHRYDIIELANWPGHCAYVPRHCPAAYVARVSTSCADTNPGGSWVPLALEKRAVSRGRMVMAHSEAMNRKGQTLYGYPPERGVVVNLGLPDRPLPPPPVADSTLVLVSLGRAEDRKGTDLLLRALGRVLPEFPTVVYRSIGPGLYEYLTARPELRAIWESLRGQVEDLGRLSEDEKDRCVGAAHWLVAPSRFESFGLMAVEAMRAGTPVVYAAVGGLAEVGAKGPQNIAVNGDDAADLERGLREVCRRGIGHAVAVRAAARDTFERHFREDAMIEQTLEVYRSVLSCRTPSHVAGGAKA